MQNTPFLLIILDGWGVAPDSRSNAITQADTPAFDYLLQNYWVQTLQAAGDAVGLPWGEMGNSEVGHLSLGAGKIIYQDLPRITRAVSDGSFFKNPKFLLAVKKVKKQKSALHLAGLLSDGGVHSHIEHLDALLELCAEHQVPEVYIHCFLDGRDAGYNTALGYIEDLEHRIKQFKVNARIATIAGRYWAMDRDNRWDRIIKGYQAMVYGQADRRADKAVQAIESYYQQEIYDEQIPPTIIGPQAPIRDNDAVIFFNFRADRMRQLATSLVLPDFNKFDRGKYLSKLLVVTMTEYDKGLPAEIAFPLEKITKPLAKVLSEAQVRQLHIAETEKYAHITFFLNGGTEEAFPGEDRMLVPSPQASDYSEVPEMSAPEITTRLIREIGTGKYDFVVVNFANADMVGHTGNLPATKLAVKILDDSLKQLTDVILSLNGVILVTSDHGNAESLFDLQSGEISKEHTFNPVPCILVGKNFVEQKKIVPDLSTYTPRGVLADVAPTILKIIGIDIPLEMTGCSLI
ncbi:MAG: 2,3-bisphosphoglycerate-independent phosphoglycerate mutase [Candidatus Jacksonbacteria bacterium]